MDASAYEKLGEFYLGRRSGTESTGDEPFLYDSRNLTTHAVCMGMTGSGKTGLCIGLLEEAALDGISAIAIDPKGDIANLLLTFPDLAPADFEPWLDPGEVTRRGTTPAALAQETAQRWRDGLSASGQDGERIRRLRATCDLAVYTPGSRIGIPLAVLRSFTAPDASALADVESMRERIAASVSGLLGLIGIDADPLKSREHILLSQILSGAFRHGESLDLPALIGRVQNPGFSHVGVFELDKYYPEKDRLELAMAMNNLLASPGAAALAEGEPLEIPRLLFTREGKPRIAVISIAHLADSERMFFVTRLLGELIAWMRTQPGTSSLRSLLYMDEIFGYFPPSAVPPSKPPMLTLLKQARAFGVGVVLATQNPVDLDYKGLANCGTWFIGRLQTERDKMRVLDGLEGAASTSGHAFDRAGIDRLLSGLKSRSFLMNSVHEPAPVLFETRWTLSFLRGPMTREEIRRLMAPRIPIESTPPKAPPIPAAAIAPAAGSTSETVSVRPELPAEIAQVFWPVTAPALGAEPVTYRPHVLAQVRLHYVHAKAALDRWETVTLLAPMPETSSDVDWEHAALIGPDAFARFLREPSGGERFAKGPAALAQPKSYARWARAVAAHLYRVQAVVLHSCPERKQISRANESAGEFRARLALGAREARDRRLDKLKAAYTKKLAPLQERGRRAQERLAKEQAEAAQSSMDAVLSVGAGLLGAVLGRKAVSASNVSRARGAARSAGRAKKQRDDAVSAESALSDAHAKLAELEAQFQAEWSALAAREDETALRIEDVRVMPRKSDIEVSLIACAWLP